MVAQAEHIPVHLGAMPEAVAAVAAHEPRPGEIWILNDPYAGGTHLPDITTSSRDTARLRGYAGAPRRHWRVRARAASGRLAHARRRRRRHPADRLDEELLECARRADAQPRRAPRRPARATRRAPTRRASPRRARARDAARSEWRRRWTSCWPTASVSSARRSRSPRRPLRGKGRARIRGRRARDPRRGRDLRRRDHDRLRGHGTTARRGISTARLRSPALPRFFVVRCLTDPDLPASGGAFAPVAVTAPERLPRERTSPGRGRGRQRRDLIADRRRPLRGVRTGDPVPAQGQGTMNNVVLGSERLLLLRDDRRRPGSLPGRRRALRRARRDDATRSTRRSRRSSSPIRFAWSATRSGSALVGRARTAAATAWSASSVCSSRARCRCSPSAGSQAPRGSAGGADGAPGRTLVNGEELPASASRPLEAGDVVRIETPGGGGYGRS